MRRLAAAATGIAMALVTAAANPPARAIDPAAVAVDRILSSTSDLRGWAGTLLARLVGRADEPLFVRPYGVAWSGGDLLIADAGSGTVVRIDESGKISRTRPGALVQPVAVAQCFGGTAVSDSRAGGVAFLDSNLELRRWLVRGLGRPTGLACLGNELAIVDTASHRIVVVDPTGARRAFGSRGDGPGELNFPTLVAAEGEQILVGDALNFRVQRFTRDGSVVAEFGRIGDTAGTMPRMKGLAVDSRHRIWVSDAHLDQIAVYDADGAFLMTVGHSGNESGAFSFPAGLAFGSDGRLAVADSYNGRVQILRLPGGDDEGARR